MFFPYQAPLCLPIEFSFGKLALLCDIIAPATHYTTKLRRRNNP
jgi:hypothetical protein